MKLTVLGSGNADHHPDRASSGYLLQTPDPILLDLGAGTWRNLARTGVDAASIRLILLSHHHVDHFADLVTFLFHQKWYTKGHGREGLTILAPPGTAKIVDGLRRTIPGLDRHGFSIDVRDMDSGSSEFGPVRVTPARVPHVDDLVAVAWRVEAEGRTFVYSGDCRESDEVVTALKGADLAVVEATFPDESPHPVHLTAGQACDLAARSGVKRLVLSHLSRMWDGRDPAAEGRGAFPGEVVAATDLLISEL